MNTKKLSVTKHKNMRSLTPALCIKKILPVAPPQGICLPQPLRNQHRMLSLMGPTAVNSGTAEAATAPSSASRRMAKVRSQTSDHVKLPSVVTLMALDEILNGGWQISPL